MQVTLALDDALYERALELAEPGTDANALVHQALTVFIQRQVARRLIALGGTRPDMEQIPRRRFDWPDEPGR